MKPIHGLPAPSPGPLRYRQDAGAGSSPDPRGVAPALDLIRPARRVRGAGADLEPPALTAEKRAKSLGRQRKSGGRTHSLGASDRGTFARSTAGSISGRDRRPFRLTNARARTSGSRIPWLRSESRR